MKLLSSLHLPVTWPSQSLFTHKLLLLQPLWIIRTQLIVSTRHLSHHSHHEFHLMREEDKQKSEISVDRDSIISLKAVTHRGAIFSTTKLDKNILFRTAVSVISKSTENVYYVAKKQTFYFSDWRQFFQKFMQQTNTSTSHDGCVELTSRPYPTATT